MKYAALATVPLLVAALAGCTNPFKEPDAEHYAEMGYLGNDPSGRDRSKWPDLHGAKVRILDNGAFDEGFAQAKASFERLTNATLEQVKAQDAGTALQTVIEAKGKPPADVIYGVDNAYYGRALEAGVLHPYKPLLAHRISPEHVFFADPGQAAADIPNATWLATPVDYGYIALNFNPENATGIHSLEDVLDQAEKFVTQDPHHSSPGLGFLIITIATYGEEGLYDWKDYWHDLFANDVLVTEDWSTAYVQHFSAGYGAADGLHDRDIVTSYTESPAFEAFFGRNQTELAHVLLAPESTFKQVQTMAILEGAENIIGAEAWVEFTLTDEFQRLAASPNGVYPVVQSSDPRVDPAEVYKGLDPIPTEDQLADIGWVRIRDSLERWLCEWTAVKEKDNAGLAGCRNG